MSRASQLTILDEHPEFTGADVYKVGDAWATTAGYLGYWIGGFATAEDAQLVHDAIEKACEDAREAMTYS